MEIWFGDDETAELCSRTAKLTARWGPAGGKAVGRRLIQIEAAPTIEALCALPGKCRLDAANGTWLVDVEDIAVIRFRFGSGTAGTACKAHVISVSNHPTGRTRR
jgi:plasmid maintenance system killer protein